jgi:hypothetical protein
LSTDIAAINAALFPTFCATIWPTVVYSINATKRETFFASIDAA